MGTVLAVYHSLADNTKKMAEAVAEGARGVDGRAVSIRRAAKATHRGKVINCFIASRRADAARRRYYGQNAARRFRHPGHEIVRRHLEYGWGVRLGAR